MITKHNDGVTTYQFTPNISDRQKALLEQAISNFSFLIPWGKTITWQEFATLIADTGNYPRANLVCSIIEEVMGGDR